MMYSENIVQPATYDIPLGFPGLVPPQVWAARHMARVGVVGGSCQLRGGSAAPAKCKVREGSADREKWSADAA